MRVKVECGPPLPSLRAWFIVPAAASTVAELKDLLCSELPALRHIPSNGLTLSLDGFELIDASAIDVIRDGELITVKQISSSSNKRKITDEVLSPSKRVKRTTEPPALVPKVQTSQKARAVSQPTSKPVREEPSSNSETESSSDSDTGSESSSSESDSDSDNSSDESSSSTSSAPSVEPSKATVRQQTESQIQQKIAKPSSAGHVPPGQGKATTQSRNARRRRKKMYERVAAQVEPASTNDIPLGERRTVPEEPAHSTALSQQPRIATPGAPTFMMASLSNKNKRKGFKQAMTGMLPPKLVFSAEDDAPGPGEAALPFNTTPAVEMAAAALNMFSRLVPPSEKQEKGQIPANMFVTSIDVEEGMHTSRKKNKKKAIEKKLIETHAANETAEVENMVLDYGEPNEHIPTQREQPSPAQTYPEGDWVHVESNWADLPKITEALQLQSGALVGWKALGINPATFTPEFMLTVGRVMRTGDHLTVQPVHKPGAVEVSFGGYADEEPGDVVPLEEETFEWSDVYAGDWKIV